MSSPFDSLVLETTGASRITQRERVQSLWSGYGELLRLHLDGCDVQSVIVKYISPPTNDETLSRARKCRSYDVELAFYKNFAHQTNDLCRTAKLLASQKNSSSWTFVFEDLEAAGFPKRLSRPKGASLDACLHWLASFHATFLGQAPNGLWKVGTYWHLGTRLEECARIRDASIREAAPELDRGLREAKFQTLVHGDAKAANFCFSFDRTKVAAVDFQYVGQGPGIKDVAYLLAGEAKEREALEAYFKYLLVQLSDFDRTAELEEEWRELYPLAKEDFQRFLAGWSG